jgi:succinylglutamate desuccinylase
MKKQILLILATHGDEKIGLETVKILENCSLEKYFDILIANPKACKNNKRFIDVDLNRSYPGNLKSDKYEQKIAAENLLVAKKYKYVIDIHEASQGTDDFIIVPRKELSKQFPLKYINLETVLLWPDPRGPLGQVLKNAVELEFGSKNRNRNMMANKCAMILDNFIKNVYGLPQGKIKPTQKIFYVYDKLSADKTKQKLIDFKKIKIKKEEFYPLLTNQYLMEGIVCYKMKKIK